MDDLKAEILSAEDEVRMNFIFIIFVVYLNLFINVFKINFFPI